MERTIENTTPNKCLKRQNRLFYWTLIAFALFMITLVISTLRYLFRFDSHLANHNFVFNFLFLFPATVISCIIMLFTGGLTVGQWKDYPNLTKKISTIILAFGEIIFVCYCFIMALNQP